MATTATSFAPSHHFSTPSKSSHANVSPLTPPPNPLAKLPQVNFNFEDLRQRMSAFTVKFDAFIERGRKRVLEERNEFRGRLGEIAGECKPPLLLDYLTD
jgi:kinetochore protein Spc25, fungi type